MKKKSPKLKIGDKGLGAFARTRALVPNGNGTMSKVATLPPDEPSYIVRGKGCRVWDVDGNEYIDFKCCLGPNSLGYCHPSVDEAIRRQLKVGISFGHPNPLETELAEQLVEVIPCAERVRFLKTGNEAMQAAFKVARAHSGRDRILSCGYHGWSHIMRDNRGVPGCVADLRIDYDWGDLAGVERILGERGGEIAAVSLAASYAQLTAGDDFPSKLRNLTKAHGVLLIIDEIVTGFRLRIGGFHEYYGFKPDLAVFSKALANGMPISVFCGSREVMSELENNATVSSTFSGELLSVAAALATLKVYRTEGVIDHLWNIGGRFSSGMNRIFAKHGLPLSWKGLAPCTFLTPESGNAGLDDRLRRSLFRHSLRHGLMFYHALYVNFSHKEADIDEALARFDLVCRNVDPDSELSAQEPRRPVIGALANR